MNIKMFRENVETFLRSDSQWPRRLRIAHAKMQMEKAATILDFEFWCAVVDANGTMMDDYYFAHQSIKKHRKE